MLRLQSGLPAAAISAIHIKGECRAPGAVAAARADLKPEIPYRYRGNHENPVRDEFIRERMLWAAPRPHGPCAGVVRALLEMHRRVPQANNGSSGCCDHREKPKERLSGRRLCISEDGRIQRASRLSPLEPFHC
jgi:hypothetical protein